MNYSKNIRNVTENNALIIADPDLEGYYGQLPGAKAEGLKVFDIFSDKFKRLGGEVELSVNDKHTDILEKLFMKDYKIIHLSGHGVFRPDDPGRSGMVIGKDQYLSTREVKQLSSAAELVFINCCHLGKADGVSEELYQKRYQLAANMGIQLINNGVRCVIAAGWAINDRAAEIFADVFYDCMFAGENFADAIKKARIAVYEYNSEINTWGAYQCYGDPFYKFRLSESKGSGYTYMIEQQAEVDLTNLRHELEMGRDKDEEKYLAKLEAITQAVKDAKIINPRILELEALIYMDLGEYDISNEKFEKLMDEERASFSFSSAEKFCNVKAKKAVADYKDSKSKKSESLKKIDEAINHLDHLIQLSETSERLNLIGSAYKRKALLSAREGKKRAYNMAALKYREAYHEANKESENWYSKTNWLALESVLVAIGWHKWGSDVDQKRKKVGYKLPPTGEVERMLDPRKVQSYREVSRLHYWDLIYEINVRLARYILRINKRNAEKGKNDILKRLENLWKVAGSRGKKISEVENLEFLIDAASLGDNPKSKLLVNYLGKLKTGIEDML
jgi:hypothetical protein